MALRQEAQDAIHIGKVNSNVAIEAAKTRIVPTETKVRTRIPHLNMSSKTENTKIGAKKFQFALYITIIFH